MRVKEELMRPYLAPILSIIAGILTLVQPKLLNYIVVLYLIITGSLGILLLI